MFPLHWSGSCTSFLVQTARIFTGMRIAAHLCALLRFAPIPTMNGHGFSIRAGKKVLTNPIWFALGMFKGHADMSGRRVATAFLISNPALSAGMPAQLLL